MKRHNATHSFWGSVVLLAAWQVTSSMRVLNPLFFPSPSAVLAAAVKMSATGELWRDLGTTLARVFAGFLIGAIPGVLCGILTGSVGWVRRGLEPLISALNSTPKLALLPMLLLLFGIGETARLLLIAAACFVTMTMQGMDAVAGINKALVELAINYGAAGTMLWRKVYVPSTLPQVFTGLRLSLGRALVVTISVEMVTSGKGLGGLIWIAWQTFSTEKLYVGVILSAVLGATFHSGLKHLEARLTPWERGLESPLGFDSSNRAQSGAIAAPSALPVSRSTNQAATM